MLAKLLALVAATKGATVAAVVVLSAATVTVGAASPEVQDAVKSVVQTVTAQSPETKTDAKDCTGQPAVVAQRNAATKLLDAAFQVDHTALEGLRGKGVDNQAAGDLIKTTDDQLKALRTKALNDVAALTLGREGQTTGSDSTTPSTSSCGSGSADAAAAPKSDAPKTADGTTPKQEGRVTVAERTTPDANIKTIVDKAVAAMDALVTDAQAKAGALVAPDHGKPSGNPGEDHKPSDTPKR